MKNFFIFGFLRILALYHMHRPQRMDEIVGIMANAHHQHRRLSHDETKKLDQILHSIFHKQ